MVNCSMMRLNVIITAIYGGYLGPASDSIKVCMAQWHRFAGQIRTRANLLWVIFCNVESLHSFDFGGLMALMFACFSRYVKRCSTTRLLPTLRSPTIASWNFSKTGQCRRAPYTSSHIALSNMIQLRQHLTILTRRR